jgi:hypothetical protein
MRRLAGAAEIALATPDDAGTTPDQSARPLAAERIAVRPFV